MGTYMQCLEIRIGPVRYDRVNRRPVRLPVRITKKHFNPKKIQKNQRERNKRSELRPLEVVPKSTRICVGPPSFFLSPLFILV